MNAEEVRHSADALRIVLGHIDTGQIEASETQRAYLTGALDTLNQLLQE